MRPVLLTRAGGLGDVLLLRRAIASLRARGYPVWLMAPRRHAEVLLGPAGVEWVLDAESPEASALYGAEAQAPNDLARSIGRCAAVVAYTNSDTLAAGLRRSVPSVIVHAPLPPRGQHAAEWYCEGIRAIAPMVPHPPICQATPHDQSAIREIAGKLPPHFVAIHPGSGSPRKNWPPELFAAAIRELADGESWLLVEGPADQNAAHSLAALPGAVSARDLPVRQLAALLAFCGVFVGNDSGVSHLAAAWGAPTLAIFGPTDACTWRPDDAHVEVLVAKSGRVADVEVARVVVTASRLRLSDPRREPECALPGKLPAIPTSERP